MSKIYNFLNLIKESEAALRGSQVIEKIHHSIYKKIQSLSNINSIRSGGVYTLSIPIKELQTLELPKLSYLNAIKNLINDNLIVQLGIFHFIEETKELKFQSCYISFPLTEDINTQILYNEIIQYSMKSIKKYIDSKPVVSKQELLNDYELDLKSIHKPNIEKLKYSLFDPTTLVIPSSFDINPEPEILTTIKKDLRNELIRQKVCLELFEYGLMQFREDELVIRYESADEFMRNKVVPKYKSDTNFKTEYDAILLEESVYYMDAFVPKSTEYSKKMAESLKKNISTKSNAVRFPGMLVVEIIRNLSDILQEHYQKEFTIETYKQAQFYIDKIKQLEHESSGDIVLYINQEELEEINGKVIEIIKSTNDIMYLRWNINNDIIHIFAYKEPEIFYKIISKLLMSEKIEHWKVLALKFLIEQYEDEFPNLFENQNFRESYGKLLRKVYINYMPWYFKIIIWINFPFFQNLAFQTAKEKILKEQELLEDKNKKLLEQRQLLKIQEKKEKLAKARDINNIVKIVDKVQNLLSKGEIPYIKNLLQEFSGWEEKEFMDFLKNNNFVLMPLKEEQVVLYPKNFNWKIYAKRMHQIITQALSTSKSDLNIEKNKLELNRIRSFIDLKLKSNISNENTDDPYQKLEKKIKREKNISENNITTNDLPDEIEI